MCNKTVGQNLQEMRDLAVQIMADKLSRADEAAENGSLDIAKRLLLEAEQWRQRARSHGAEV